MLLKDITAILLHYDHPQALERALSSLNVVRSRLASILVFCKKDLDVRIPTENMGLVQWISFKNDIGDALNQAVRHINSPYTIFLQQMDYISPQLQLDTLELPQQKTVLATFGPNELVSQPFLIRTAFLRKKPFLHSYELPFKEALLPVWMAQIEEKYKIFKQNVLRKLRQSRNRNIVERQKYIGKYQRQKKSNKPTLAIAIANYNMEDYVATAIRSGLLQTDEPNQILLMDDGSTDQSRHIMNRFHDGDLVRFFSKSNEGKARALNDLLPHVTSEYLLELDADDFLDPDALAVIKKQLPKLTEDTALLYGNFRRWKETEEGLLIKGMSKGRPVRDEADLLTYRFPLGPRIYRTELLNEAGGFPVIPFKEGRIYEDVSVLLRLIKKYRFQYYDFTVYNVREHGESITRTSGASWKDYLKALDY